MAASQPRAGAPAEDLSKLNPAAKRMHGVAEEYWEKRAHGPAEEDASTNSVLQQMMDAAFASKAEVDADTRASEAAAAKKSFKKGGMKRGFLSKPVPKKATTPKQAPAPAPKPAPARHAGIVEVGEDGAFDADAALPEPEEEVPVLKAAADAAPGLAMPEVQAAMKEKLGAFGEKLAGGSWMTPELQQRIFTNPRIMAGMQNPACMAALQEFQSGPDKAMAKYADDPMIRGFLTEFFGVMGDHFTKMGAAEDAANPSSAPAAAAAGGPAAGADIGMKARSTKKTAKGAGTPPPSFVSMDAEKRKKQAEAMAQAARRGDIGKEDAEVQQVLKDPAVLQLLMDPAMQRVLEECRQQPARLGMYMRNPTVRDNLLKLQEAGLIRITK